MSTGPDVPREQPQREPDHQPSVAYLSDVSREQPHGEPDREQAVADLPDVSREQPQSELDREQAVADVDQGIADRRQARADRDQEPLDAAQLALNADVAASDTCPGGVTASQSARQADIHSAQHRRNAHQAQLDDNQLAQGVRQDLLDGQQAVLDALVDAGLDDVELIRARAAEELQQALRERAEVKLARAEDARHRAAEGLSRLRAAETRRRTRDGQN